ncbi:hypothetical protein VP424E501_P0275 [Vibrio phage 424E50-1]|nr:hypothetical protein VP424E501_P0275 [Vibrio phage 424E50-1]
MNTLRLRSQDSNLHASNYPIINALLRRQMGYTRPQNTHY